MLELKTYSKKELGELLNVSYSRTDIITKKLKKMGYEFKTSGRGDNYSIEITLIPDLSLKEFAKNEFNIDVRFPDRLAHFINLLLSPIGSDLLGMNARTISHFTKLSDELIKDYLEAFISCGLLEKHCCEESYYATKRKNNEDMAPNGDYTYFYLAKIITKDEYQKAYNAFYSSYNSDTKDIDNNPDIIKGFSRAINKGLKFVSDNDAETIAKSIISFFPDTALNDLITMIDRYKKGDAYRETISINEEEWKHIQDIMIAAGELDEYAPYDKLIYGKYFNEFE